jgi:hypothetical protein
VADRCRHGVPVGVEGFGWAGEMPIGRRTGLVVVEVVRMDLCTVCRGGGYEGPSNVAFDRPECGGLMDLDASFER